MLFLLVSYSFADESSNAKEGDAYLTSALQRERNDEGVLNDLKLPNVFEVIMRFLFSLLLIIGFIFGAALLYKKYFGGRYLVGRENEAIKVLAHRYLDPKKSLYLVEVGQKILVIGTGADELHLITEITDPDGVRSVYKILEMKSEVFKTRDFKSVLSGVTKPDKRTNKENSDTKQGTVPRSISSIQEQIQKIKRMINEK